MKVTKQISYSAAPYGHIADIPAGLRVIPASNLPKDSAIKYWLDELTPEMEADPQIESWHRNYGFGLTEDEVTEPLKLNGNMVAGSDTTLSGWPEQN